MTLVAFITAAPFSLRPPLRRFQCVRHNVVPRQRRVHAPLVCTQQQNRTPSALFSRLRDVVESKLLLGHSLNAELSAILSVYFIQGALSMSRLAVSFYLKDDLALTPASVASLTALAGLPWVLKPVYGFLSDSVPVYRSRRRAYLALSGALGALAWLKLASGVDSTSGALIAMICASLSVAVSDVVADGLVVERVRTQPSGAAATLQTLCWGSSAVGGLLAAAASGSALSMLGARRVFALTALLPAATTGLAALISEAPSPSLPPRALAAAAATRAKTLWGAITARHVVLPVAFVFAWQASPSCDSALFFFQTNALGFGPDFLGIVRLASAAAALAGLYCYQRFWKDLPVKTLMKYAALASVPLSLTQVILVTRLNIAWGISDQLFALTDSAVLTALGQVAFMPTLVLAARLCPPGIEGTLFAALMSVYNASGSVSSQLGAVLTHALNVTESDFSNLWLLVTICSFSNLISLPLLNFVDEAPDDTVEDINSNIETNQTSGLVEGARDPVIVTTRKESDSGVNG